MQTQPQTPKIKPYSTSIPLTIKVKRFLQELDKELKNEFTTEDQKFRVKLIKASADAWFKEEINAIENNQI